MSRVLLGGAGSQGVGCPTVGKVHGEKGGPGWKRSKVSRVLLVGAGPW